MCEAEFERAMTLLGEAEQAQVLKIRSGKWIVVSERGVLCVAESKAAAIQETLSRHCQSRSRSKVKRLRAGIYQISIPDIDEAPTEHYKHTYRLARVNSDNMLRFREISITEYLPDWYFSPYTQEYQQFFTPMKEEGGKRT